MSTPLRLHNTKLLTSRKVTEILVSHGVVAIMRDQWVIRTAKIFERYGPYASFAVLDHGRQSVF